MAIVIRKPGQIGALLRRQLERDRDLVARVALETAQRGLAKAIAETDRQGLVDRGTFKLSWKAERVPGGAELRNDAPYAAVIEYGRRPGRPGPPLAPILAWVHRKLVANGQVQEKDAEEAARDIRDKIHFAGSPPHHILTDLVPDLRRWFKTEALRRLKRRHGN